MKWWPLVWVAGLGAAAILVSLLYSWLMDPGTSREAAGPADLVGRWARLDGDYVLDIRRVAEDDTLDVGYFNPQPINVARGELSRDDGLLRVFVKLQDKNYPGSTYTLRYDPEHRMLVGEYIQPLTGEKFDVAFVRE